jgi:tripartite-type tricarboxylate transporter receptor subunit TctC
MKRILSFGAALLFSLSAAAQFPSKPVRVIVPYTPGGGTDIISRALAAKMQESWGQQVLVENRPGANGIIGTEVMVKSPPDGHVVAMVVGAHVVNAVLQKSMPFDPIADTTAVSLVATSPWVIGIWPGVPAQNLKEFIAYAKANQGKMQFGSGGAGTSSHIGCVLLNQTIGVDTTHVPYRGGGPAMADLFAGRVDYVCNIASTVGQAVEGKQAKALAALTRERSPILPDLPTAHEQGLAGFDAYTWNAVFLPKGTPPPLVQKLNAALVAVMANPAFRERLHALGLIVVAPERRTPAYLQTFVESEIEKWAVPIKASGVKED